jgi:hypothetical protein
MTEICPHQPATYAAGLIADRCGRLPHLPRAVRVADVSVIDGGQEKADPDFCLRQVPISKNRMWSLVALIRRRCRFAAPFDFWRDCRVTTSHPGVTS